MILANALCIIKNGARANLAFVDIKQGNSLIEKVLKIMNKDGYIKKYLTKVSKGQKQFRVFLTKNDENKPLITDVIMVSKSGRRMYAGNKNLPYPPRGFGVGIVSTSKGVMPIPKAKKMGLGGEVICFIV